MSPQADARRHPRVHHPGPQRCTGRGPAARQASLKLAIQGRPSRQLWQKQHQALPRPPRRTRLSGCFASSHPPRAMSQRRLESEPGATIGRARRREVQHYRRRESLQRSQNCPPWPTGSASHPRRPRPLPLCHAQGPRVQHPHLPQARGALTPARLL
eukprot:scaffold130974_cov21-Tisochrysis_lutea.AAC.2